MLKLYRWVKEYKIFEGIYHNMLIYVNIMKPDVKKKRNDIPMIKGENMKWF